MFLAGGDQDAEPGARLTCHLLLRLFKTSHLILTGVPSFCNSMKEPSMIKASCDCHLLEAAHDSITLGPVLAVLKAILVLGERVFCPGKTFVKYVPARTVFVVYWSDLDLTSADLTSTCLFWLDLPLLTWPWPASSDLTSTCLFWLDLDLPLLTWPRPASSDLTWPLFYCYFFSRWFV